jgi:hypothetical protein
MSHAHDHAGHGLPGDRGGDPAAVSAVPAPPTPPTLPGLPAPTALPGPSRLIRLSLRRGSVSIDVPAAWETIAPVPEGCVVAALEPGDTDRFRTSFVLTFAPVEGDVAQWQAATDRRHEQELDDYLLLDLEPVQIAGHLGTRRLTTHSTPAHESVTTESWSTLSDGVGVTLTARVATLRVTDLAPVIDAVAATLVVRAEGLVPA